MTSRHMALGHLRRAERILGEAERLRADGDFGLVVRRCQEAVELALKAALRAAGAEVPKVHDVSGALRQNAARLHPAVAAELDTLVSTSRRLREEREIAFYGDEETDTTSQDLFSAPDAETALGLARHVVTLCRRAIG